MALYRWKLLNKGGLMKMKRWFGFLWRDHEDYENVLNRHRRKLQGLYEDFRAEHERLLAAERKKKEAIAEVNDTKDCTKGLSEPFSGPSFTGTVKRLIEKPREDWKVFASALKGEKATKSRKKTWTLPSSDYDVTFDGTVDIPQGERRALDREVNRTKHQKN